MFSRIVEFKDRFSHVKSTDWQYQLVQMVWESKAEGKACTFWWIKLTSSFLVLVAGIFLFLVILGLALIFGYIPIFIRPTSPEMIEYKRNNHDKIFYPHMVLPNGKKLWAAPWMLIMPIVGGLYLNQNWETVLQGISNAPSFLWERITYTPMFLLSLVFSLLLVFIFLMFIALIGAFIVTMAKVMDIGKGWDKVCPPLVVEPGKEEE